MIGVLIASHGSLAMELQKTVEKIIGPQPQVAVLTTSGRQRKQLRDDVERLIASLDSGDGVLVMVDSPGGTPANICLEAARGKDKVEVLASVNLPMLMCLIDRKDRETVHSLAQSAISAGKATIINLTDAMSGCEEIDGGKSGGVK